MFIDVKNSKVREKLIEYLERKGIPYTEATLNNITKLEFQSLSDTQIKELGMIIEETETKVKETEEFETEKYDKPIFIEKEDYDNLEAEEVEEEEDFSYGTRSLY